MQTADVIVIGGGIVGAAIAYGVQQVGASAVVLDEGDRAIRAARANFGLIWVQSKGDGMPPYARWTRRSADLWPGFADKLGPVGYEQPGGLSFCLSEADLERERQRAQRMQVGTRILGRAEVEALVPGVGPTVAGAAFGPHDGHCNPLKLLRALYGRITVRPDAPARTVTPGRVFRVETPAGRFEAPKLVLAAGHGITALAPGLGLVLPIRPERGQILVTERLAPLLRFPASGVRQTDEGTVMIGSSKEAVGLDTGTSAAVMGRMAARAVKVLPALARARLVRAWAGLRVLTPDGCPVYAESRRWPGAFVATCHSGVTLAAAHALELAPALLSGDLSALAPFSPERFDVPAAA